MAHETHVAGPEYQNLVVACPFCSPETPNPEHSQPAGVFLQTEVGRQVLLPLIEEADHLREDGVDFTEAVDSAFGKQAVRDEQEKFITVSSEDLSHAKADFNVGAVLLAHELTEDSGLAKQQVRANLPLGAPQADSLGNKIKQIRRERNVTDDEVAQKAGIPVDYYQKIEEDQIIPPANVYIRILASLETRSADIFPGQ